MKQIMIFGIIAAVICCGMVSPLATAGATETYTLTYDANGGDTGTIPSAQSGNGTVTLAAGTALKKGTLYFSGWNTSADGSGDYYAGGATFTLNVDTTLYAQYSAIPGVNVPHIEKEITTKIGDIFGADNVQYVIYAAVILILLMIFRKN